ncbi:MAG TPA: sugar ABC transporter permease [Thermomicrobiales bacterium]|jgi:cellobiose transport system permease protein|nr:sugar ABC transporter permease [Thermomicrobiales bacterium]
MTTTDISPAAQPAGTTPGSGLGTIQEPAISALTKFRQRYMAQYIAIAPFYILFAIFGLFPIIFALYLAFQNWDGIAPMEYVGLAQFEYLLTDRLFYDSVLNTLIIWVLSTVPMLAFALVLAFMLNQSIRGKSLYRIGFFIPNVTSIVAIAIVFGSLFGNQFGLINALLRSIGADQIGWLTSDWGIKLTVAAMVIWRWTGYNAIIYLAGLQAIPDDLYDAAKVDGADTWRLFRDITIPLLRPVILFTVITSTIGGLQIFTEPQVLFGDSSGGPGSAGQTMVLYLYDQAFVQNQFGYGAAVGWGIFVVVLAFSIINWRVLNRPAD